MAHTRDSQLLQVPFRLVVLAAILCVAFAVPVQQSHADDVSPRLTAWSAPETRAPAKWVDDLRPIKASDWSYDRAAHLLERAGFSGTPEEIERLAAMTPSQAVDYLVDYEAIPEEFTPYDSPPIWGEEMETGLDRHMEFLEALEFAQTSGEFYGIKVDESAEYPYQEIAKIAAFKLFSSHSEWARMAEWWANRMVETPRPLEEKMTLFWHGHFANQINKTEDHRVLFNQNLTFRRLATTNFRKMLVAVSQDPSMLIYLDNRRNTKEDSNENYAREIMELFALGVGNYTEMDIKEVGRAFTGWRNEGLRFINDPTLHDEGQKTIFGKTGNWDGYDAIDLILEEEVCAEWMAGKIHRFFVRQDMSPELKTELAAVFRDNNYEMKPLLKTIFLSRDFYSKASVGTQIKSPVQYYISACRRLGLDELPGTPVYNSSMAGLGQSLGNPPNVKGWDGGRMWINPSTLLQRANMMQALLATRDDSAPSGSSGPSLYSREAMMDMGSSNKGPAGEWKISNTVQGQTNETTMSIVEKDGEYTGTMDLGGPQPLSEVTFEKGELSFKAEVAGTPFEFSGTVNGDSLDGKIVIAGMEIETTGTRSSDTPAEVADMPADAGEEEESETVAEAPGTAMLNASPDYDINRAAMDGIRMGYELVKPIPTTPAELDIAAMAKTAGVETADDAVDYFVHRFLRVKLDESDRQLTISYMKELSGGEQIDYDSPDVENHLRELLHAIMSMPEFQLS